MTDAREVGPLMEPETYALTWTALLMLIGLGFYKVLVMAFTCRHRDWEPIDLQQVEPQTLTWTSARCLQCGMVRDSNLLQPKESMHIDLTDLLRRD